MRGQYVYDLNGARTDIREHWQVTPAPSGRIIRSERSAHAATLSVYAVETGGVISRFDIRYRAAQTDICARYILAGQEITVERSLNGQTSAHHLRADAPFIPLPALRVFTGGVIQQLAAHGQPACVLVPWLFDPAQTGRFLMPHFDTRSARLLEMDGDLGVYEYTGEQYDTSARFWVNAAGLLARYTWRQSDQLWDVRLTPAQSTFPALEDIHEQPAR